MGSFFVYIIKSAVCLLAFLLFYRLLLSRETFHRFNRFAISGILSLSLLIPFCKVSIINIERQTEVQQTVLSLEQLLSLDDKVENPAVQRQMEGTAWVKLLWIAYLAGIMFFVVRNIYSLIRLYLLLRTGEWKKLGNKATLIIHDRNDLAPFSWVKYIVISRKDFGENGREILIHELAHIYNRHSLDLLISNICILFQWFNPAAWLLKQELQNIHEYEADERVIKEGVDAKQYQLLIIKKAAGARLYSMASSFNHSKLKKRITMMLKEKSNPWARLKYLYVLPLAAIAVSVFARPETPNELKDLSEVKANVFTVDTVINAIENDTVQLPADSSKTEDVRTTPPSSPEQPSVDSPEAKEKSGDANTRTYVFSRESNSEAAIAVRANGTPEPLIFIDGKEVKVSPNLDPDRIENIEVLKDQAAVERYGDRAKQGVILITLKKEEKQEEVKE
ncbi:MAG: TonB-dependent receptor plug domain-containing protein [Mediterranea sp.]|jgi:beta-lactamase regulating signal transducer with metallopeptidase domain|nr:TonB-dependent receptor plug domain-containing protein [Mediterranea sp.]